MRVIKRNGEECDIEFDEIVRKIKQLAIMKNLTKLNIDAGKLTHDVIALIYDGITTSELDEFTASTAASLSLYNNDYNILAGRIIANNHIKNTPFSFTEAMLKLDYIVSDSILKLCHEVPEKLNSIICEEHDYLISYFGFTTLYKSYLLRRKEVDSKKIKKVIERPQYLFLRVALGIHVNEEDPNSTDFVKVKNTYDLLSTKCMTHATPTLFNAGTNFSQMSSCFLIGTEDSVTGIYKTISDVAQISKWAGGIGVHISNIRAQNSLIAKTNGESQGIMPMLKVYNDTARYINQSSKRLGSFAMYIEPWHADIFAFLDAKKNNGAEELRARDLFYALWVPDLFIKRVRENSYWSLMCPNECPGLCDIFGTQFEELYNKYESEGKYRKQIPAIELWNAIINSQIESGTPYMSYKDHANNKSNQSNLGTIKSSNLCNEIYQYSDSSETAVCNLASICLSQLVNKTKMIKNFSSFNERNKMTIYSKNNCKYCDLTKELLLHYNINFEVIDLSNDEERMDFYEEHSDLEAKIIVNTMPQIFSNETRIGGYTELKDYLDNQIETITTFDYHKLSEITETLVENIDIIIDKNFYPTPESKKSNLRHRPMGIGVQGLADVFHKFEIAFTSDKAKQLNKNIFECMYYHALKKSNELAKTKGSYSTFENSHTSNGQLQFDLWQKNTDFYPIEMWNSLKTEIKETGLRNSLLIALMPTASTAQIMGNNESFEPYTSNIYTRRVLAGEFVVINDHLIEFLKEKNIYTKELIDKIIIDKGSIQKIDIPEFTQEVKERFKTVWEISQKKIIEMSAERGPFICQSQSLNIFVEKADPKIISSVHLYGHSLGLKTGSYYIRTKPVLSSANYSMEFINQNNNKSNKKETITNNEKPEDCLMCSG